MTAPELYEEMRAAASQHIRAADSLDYALGYEPAWSVRDADGCFRPWAELDERVRLMFAERCSPWLK